MKFDAFSGGINPGGLRNRNEIKIMICYLIDNLNRQINKNLLIQILVDNGFANYFEIITAMSELFELKHIEILNQDNDDNDDDFYAITETGKLIAEQLHTALTITVREKVLETAVKLLARVKRQKENKVDIIQTEYGYKVNCHISGGNNELMCIQLFVPDLMQAKIVRERFLDNPDDIYRHTTLILTGDFESTKNMIKKP